MNQVSTVERPRRREYSVEFKASVLTRIFHGMPLYKPAGEEFDI